jgi:dTDP-4-amino-4,6-dideoxygalactose transaminase
MVQVNYFPVYRHPVFLDLGHYQGEFLQSEIFYSKEISLPMYSTITDEEVLQVASEVKKLI